MSRISLVTLLAFLLGACAPTSASDPVVETEEDKTFYALGLALGENLLPFAMSEEELERVRLGMFDRVLDRERKLEDPLPYLQSIQGLQNQRKASAAGAERDRAREYVAQVAAEAGATTTDSGIVYTEVVAGEGESPSPTSVVLVHYHGQLRDGSTFDSSVDRGKPSEFPLNRVIPCWTEALQKMRAGGKAKITCPPDLAYGDQGTPNIPPGSALTFDVELLEVKAPPAPPETPAG